jgi:DNA-binding SARP family transcriptional activator
MDPVAIQRKKREAASQDLADIEALSKSAPFNRYFVGEINRLFQESQELALSGKTAEDRDRGRYRAMLLREISEMPAKHRAIAEAILSAPDIVEPRPTQAG